MKVTIFTSTYNRAYIIDRLYESLLCQTCKDFEWIIVDDGSTDDTEQIVKSWQTRENGFDIIYKKTVNGGKHRAVNQGIQLARGELFFIVDSDDTLTEDAVEKLIFWSLQLDDSHKFAAISGAKGYDRDTYVGGMFSGEGYVDAKNNQREKYNLTGDKAEAYFTEVLKKYPFPEFEGEKFITEEVVWNAIACDGYYIRWYRDIIYICDYLEDGLTKNGNLKYVNNPQGVLYWVKIQFRTFPKNMKKKLGAINRYYEAVCQKKTMKQIAADVGVSVAYCKLAVFAAKVKRKLRR